jgi:hypothetical protein
MSIDGEEFAILSAPWCRELLVHCYRMLGSHSHVTSPAMSFPLRRDQYL